MTKKNFFILLLLLVIIGGAIGGAIIFLTQIPARAVLSVPHLSALNFQEIFFL